MVALLHTTEMAEERARVAEEKNSSLMRKILPKDQLAPSEDLKNGEIQTITFKLDGKPLKGKSNAPKRYQIYKHAINTLFGSRFCDHTLTVISTKSHRKARFSSAREEESRFPNKHSL